MGWMGWMGVVLTARDEDFDEELVLAGLGDWAVAEG
jgi:hypothetical protein